MIETQEADEMALITLLSVAKDLAPDISEDLIRKIFMLQKAHQFDAERDVSLQDLQRLLDDYVSDLAGAGSK